jgi:hypothetical protein
MSDKERLSATVDPELVTAARDAVAAGRAPSVSAWVNEALRRQVDHERRMIALDRFLDEFEAAHGQITEDDVREAVRSARTEAVVVRGTHGAP